jgi:ribonuclease J
MIRAIERFLGERWDEFVSARSSGGIDWTTLREELETTLQRLIRRELQSRPLVIFLLQTQQSELIPESTPQLVAASTNGNSNGAFKGSSQVVIPEPILDRKEKTYRRRRSTASAV